MESTILDAALSQGIWAVLAVFLLVYIVKENEKRCEAGRTREKLPEDHRTADRKIQRAG